MTEEMIEKLAEAAHEVWMDGKIAEGFTYALVTDKPHLKHSCLVPYSELSETDKESNRALVRGIPAILQKAGLRITTDHIV